MYNWKKDWRQTNNPEEVYLWWPCVIGWESMSRGIELGQGGSFTKSFCSVIISHLGVASIGNLSLDFCDSLVESRV
jgi:hypothetical protein